MKPHCNQCGKTSSQSKAMPQLKLFLLALSFYTRLPGPQSQDYTKLPQAVLYLPLVGWLVGGITALSFYLADLLWPQATAVILALIVGIFLTGAFHEDGFADVCDGFGGGWGKPVSYTHLPLPTKRIV